MLILFYLSIYLSIYYLICESLVLDKRHRRGEMVATTIAMLVSHDTTTKGGRLPWFTFFIYALPFEIWSQTWVASMHWERNKYDCFNNLIEMILKICEISLFTRATPGSSLVHNILALLLAFIIFFLTSSCRQRCISRLHSIKVACKIVSNKNHWFRAVE